MSTLLEVRGLTTSFSTDRGPLRAVDDVSFDLARGATLAVVGESGSGKSVTALSVLRLLPEPVARVERGEVLFDGRDLLPLSEREMQSVRGNRISMVFQEPMTSLNPVYTVGDQIAEGYRLHRKASRRAGRERAVSLLQAVGIPAPGERVDSYPHQLSGGMRQRVMIAMALVNDPELLIADEPTTALDVTIQAQILELLARLQRERGTSILFISHDLGVVAEFASDVVVMYAGRVVESAPVARLFEAPLHPYTRGLIACSPALARQTSARRLPTIEGVVPDLTRLGSGCRFAARCDLRAGRGGDAAVCDREEPELRTFGDGRRVRCHLVEAS